MKFINILKEQEKENLTVVFAGTNGVDPMIKYWESAGLSNNDKVKFLPYTSNELPQLKKIYNVNKIIGFSGGGIKVWKEIKNNPDDYEFIGLIDPSTPTSVSTLPSNVKMVSRYENWAGCCGGPKSKKPRTTSYYNNLKLMEEKGLSERIGSNTYNHLKIPGEFFRKYKDQIL
tara:strand:+ start:38 stop:556 length:519 start_codon:yes stop_codon:yes gene_type:complete